MEKPRGIAQLYGYAICLVAVITFLISLSQSVSAIYNLSDPLLFEYYGNCNLASFETYKIDILKSLQDDKKSSTPIYIPDDKTLRVMYDAAKTNKIKSVRFKAYRELTVNSLLVLTCIVLFITHWMWLRKLATDET